MRIATWNVNSLRARLSFVEHWLAANEPDVCCLQETKCADDAFPSETFGSLGYTSAHHGNGRWNGVAILSRIGLEDERAGFFDDAPHSVEECRIVGATCGGLRVLSVYVPNGRSIDSPQYEEKLTWLGRLLAELDGLDRDGELAICGDFNIAPEDRDVWDIGSFVGATHVSEPERLALSKIVDWGLVDAVRRAHPDDPSGPFSWWDYRAGSFHRGFGMRIDHVLLSPPLAERLVEARVDREARKVNPFGKPSDHAPVVVDLAD